MNRRPRLSAIALACTFTLLCLAQCRRREATPPDVPPRAAADAAASPPASKDTWLEGTIYRFRLDEARPCPPYLVNSAMRIGVRVRVASKIDDLPVALRDFKLEGRGVILQSVFVPEAPADCAPPLAATSLPAGKTVYGVVFFDVPIAEKVAEDPDSHPLKITYQPTRLGGARGVEAVLPHMPDVWTVF